MKSKVCIITSSNIKHSTQISHYANILSKLNINYDLIYFDRYDIDEKSSAQNKFKYTKKMDSYSNLIRKLFVFIQFRKFAVNILNKKNYDLVITWNTLTAIMFYTYFKKNKIRYIHNIRDYYNEKSHIIYYLQKKIAENSVFSTISSEGFREFLPDYNYLMLHSVSSNLFIDTFSPKTWNKEIIKIGFIGNVRFFDEQIKFIDKFRNDSRFALYYYGTNSEKLKHFVEQEKINNVHLMGSFNPEETVSLIDEMDLINNIFGNNSISVKSLTSIRLYYSTYMYRPILVNTDTHLEKIVKKFNIGLSIDLNNENIKEDIWQWYKNLDQQSYVKNCKKFNSQISKENSIFESRFKDNLDLLIE